MTLAFYSANYIAIVRRVTRKVQQKFITLITLKVITINYTFLLSVPETYIFFTSLIQRIRNHRFLSSYILRIESLHTKRIQKDILNNGALR